MAKQYWLVKQEPDSYSWDRFVRDGGTVWDGVRNYQARNNLRSMKQGDPVLFYHSVGPREVIGVATVIRTAYPDPTAPGEDWSAVDLKPVNALKTPVSLDAIKAEPALRNIALIRQSRLSVLPLTATEYRTILKLGATGK